jgi:hypothetical protein
MEPVEVLARAIAKERKGTVMAWPQYTKAAGQYLDELAACGFTVIATAAIEEMREKLRPTPPAQNPWRGSDTD